MKQLYTLLFLLLFTLTGRSQCDPPIITNWEGVNDSTVSITFIAPDDGSYELVLELYYAGLDLEVYYPNGIVGEMEAGLNTIEFVMPVNITATSCLDLYYLICTMYIACDSGGGNESERFYFSNLSLAGNDNLIIEHSIEPLQPMSGDSEFEFSIDVPPSPDLIENMTFFIDFESTSFLDDFKIELVHPNETAVQITPDDFESTTLSVLFSDNSTELPEDPYCYVGVFAPFEELSTFQGLPAAGEWKVRISSDDLNNNLAFVYSAGIRIDGIAGAALLTGLVFYDENGNGLVDVNENTVPFQTIENSFNANQFTTLSNGVFWEVDEPGTGTLSIADPPNYFTSIPVGFTVAENEIADNLFLPLEAETLISDLSVDLASLWPNRPGFTTSYLARIENIGTVCENNVDVNIEFPGYVEILNSTNPDLVFADNSADLTGVDICPFQPLEFEILVVLDETVSLGTILEATISAPIPPDDPNVINNSFTSSVEVVGSYDPNDKQVSHEVIGDEFLDEESPLKYTIRFQNTGTFYAERVVIVDTIDADLDINSLNITAISHEMELSREGNVVFFEFDQIFLPDSTTDFEGSIGHVRYEIDPLPTFSEGDLIENTAYIYFDFNEPIVTNTVVTEFGNPLSTEEASVFTSLYPNPANDRITATWGADFNPERIQVHDLTGRLVMEEITRGSNLLELDVSDLPQGLYVIQFVSGARVAENRFVKL